MKQQELFTHDAPRINLPALQGMLREAAAEAKRYASNGSSIKARQRIDDLYALAVGAIGVLAAATDHTSPGPDSQRRESTVHMRIYHSGEEYKAYLTARFGVPARAQRGLSFQFKGHRWQYQHTSFDDLGDYDLLFRHVEQTEGACQEALIGPRLKEKADAASN